MKTIEITIGGHKAQFTTKSLTLGGRELLYANMSQISHDPENHIYRFTYDGKRIALPYEAKYAKVMTAIFTQVQALEAQKMSWTQALSGIHPNENPQPAAENKDEHDAAQPEAGFNVRAQVEGQENNSSEDTYDNANGQLSENADASEASGKEETPKKSLKERFASKKKEKAEASADSKVSEVNPEEEPADPEKKKKLKKSLKIFTIIIAAVIAMSAIYYFVFGTADSPSESNPNNTESQQYEDIDELIDDMQ